MKLTSPNLTDSIAGFVQHDPLTLREDESMQEVLEKLRRSSVGDRVIYLYVVDAEERLVGVLPTRRILCASVEATVGSLMVRKVVAIPYMATVAEACEWFIQYRFLAFPVVGEQRRLLGVIDFNLFTDEMVEISERNLTEDMFQLLGMQLSELRSGSPFRGFLTRFPWLLCNILGGVACAVLSSRYELLLETTLILALFIPVVLALSESVSMQTVTVTLHHMHQKQAFGLYKLGRLLLTELVTAVTLGVCCGGLVALAAWLWRGGTPVHMVIWLSVSLSMVTACLLGVCVPTLLKLFRADPRIAAGPIVLATADVLTLVFYLQIASAWLAK